MSPDFIAKWEHILEDVEKSKIPIQFIKKIIDKNKITEIRVFNPIEKKLIELVDTGKLIKLNPEMNMIYSRILKDQLHL